MATLVIGDVQGCYDELMRLLDAAAYDERRDVLWFVGDLVNRGPHSAQTLRFVSRLGERQVTVLGNHDLALLVVAEGFQRPHRGDTFADVLEAPDRDELLAWLRGRKLMHAGAGVIMVHAGLLPQWTVPQALALAREAEAALQGPGYRDALRELYGNEPAEWREDLTGAARLRAIVNAMTRLRLVTPDGRMEFSHKTGPEGGPAGYVPWFDAPRASADHRIVFGHWAALGLMQRPDAVCLDTGCVWGRSLSALRLEDGRLFQVGCALHSGLAADE